MDDTEFVRGSFSESISSHIRFLVSWDLSLAQSNVTFNKRFVFRYISLSGKGRKHCRLGEAAELCKDFLISTDFFDPFLTVDITACTYPITYRFAKQLSQSGSFGQRCLLMIFKVNKAVSPLAKHHYQPIWLLYGGSHTFSWWHQ